MERKGALSLFAFLAFATCAAAPTARAQDAATLLKQMRGAEKTVSYRAQQVWTHDGQREVADVWREGHKRRVEWTAPDVRRGDVLVDNGRNVWLYHRSENTVTQTNSRTSSGGPGSGKQGANWKVTRIGRNVVLRRDRQILTLDGKTKALVSVQRGSNAWVLKNVRFGSVDDSQFRFRSPAGAQVTRLDGTLYPSVVAARRAAAWIQVPARVPAGYHFESAVVGGNQAWLRYSNGARRFSLFQERGAQDTSDPQAVNHGAGYFWKRGGSRFLVTGLAKADVDALAASLK